jgi:hypothetical protein
MNNLAIIMDNKVEMIMQTDERLAALLLSEPLVVESTPISEGGPAIGWTYDPETKEFKSPTVSS